MGTAVQCTNQSLWNKLTVKWLIYDQIPYNIHGNLRAHELRVRHRYISFSLTWNLSQNVKFGKKRRDVIDGEESYGFQIILALHNVSAMFDNRQPLDTYRKTSTMEQLQL